MDLAFDLALSMAMVYGSPDRISSEEGDLTVKS